jgi:hypothetical protein
MSRPLDAIDLMIHRAHRDLLAILILKGLIPMPSPQFDALVQAVGNLSTAAQNATKSITDHAAVAVDANALAALTSQVQGIADTLNQAVAANPAPAAG